MLRTLLEPFDLSSSQHNEMAIAYDENPTGFTALVARVSRAKNPTAALIATVRKGEHDGATPASSSGKPARDTLEDIVAIAHRMYTARIKKYPDDGQSAAISYGAEFAPSWNRRFTFDEVRAGLCHRLRVEDENVVEFVPCPPEILEPMKVRAGRIGAMPKPSPIASAAALRANGEHFGYPTCCIDQFIEDVDHGRAPSKMRQATDGYVPCDACLAKKKQAAPTLAERLLAMATGNGDC